MTFSRAGDFSITLGSYSTYQGGLQEKADCAQQDGVWASGAATSLGSVKGILGAEFLHFLLVDFRLAVEIPLQLRLGLQMSCQHSSRGVNSSCLAPCFNSSTWHSIRAWPWK